MVPPALPDLKVIFPVPFVIALSNPIIIVVPSGTAVAPFAGLKVNGDGGTSKSVKVPIPAFIFLLLSITVVAPTLNAICKYYRRVP
jgi:hypothetical protein